VKSVEFCYWLQGFFELHPENTKGASDGISLSPAQVGLIAKHLAMVFKHEIDPSYGSEKAQQALSALHGATGKADPLKIGGVGPNGEVLRC
jgi:hypothetical protein